jgi:hypothetical protein
MLVNTLVNSAESGMDLRDLLKDGEFPRRLKPGRHPREESDALRRLARVFAERPAIVLQELVNIAVEVCGADSAGVSLEEIDDSGNMSFRWIAIAGSFTKYLNGRTPRFYSPCGTCLSTGRAQLYRVTKPYYDYLGVVAEPITDGMLIPWVNDCMRGTIWAVSHDSSEAFDSEDYALLSSLADFASIAVRHQFQETALRTRETNAASAAKANQLAHQINNPLQSLTNTIFLACKGGADAQTYAEQALEEICSLSKLVTQLITQK